MTEHTAFAALPVPWHAAFQEHSGAGCEQVHAVFWFRCAVPWSSHLPGPLHINARQGAVYWCRQYGTGGARTSTFLRASRGLARARRLRLVHNMRTIFFSFLILSARGGQERERQREAKKQGRVSSRTY